MTFSTTESQVETPKKGCVPLEEALETAGVGLFTSYMMAVTGIIQFSAICTVQVMSMIIPAAGCDLGLNGFDKGMLTSATFSGMTLSSLLFGSLADQFGRRKVMLYCSSISGILAFLASLAPNYIVLVTIWSLNGFLVGGILSPVFVYVSEFCPLRIRAKSIILPTCLGSLGAIYMPCMAWLILPLNISIPIYGDLVFSSWRLLIALVAVPAAISTFLLYKLPESPKYTLNKGNEEETLQTLRTMYALNQKKNKDEFPVLNVVLDISDRLAVLKSSERSNAMVELIRMLTQQFAKLFTPPLLLYTCLSCTMLCGIVGICNTLYLWIPEQMKNLMELYITEPDYRSTFCQVMSMGNTTQAANNDVDCSFNVDIFIISIITATVQSTIIVILSFLADKVGKKLIIVMLTTASTCGCLALLYIKEFFLMVIINCLTAVILNSIFPVGVSIIVDFFPTSLRSTAVSMTMLFGRLVATFGSQVYGALYQTHCQQLYWGIISILACSIIVNILAPSKRNL